MAVESAEKVTDGVDAGQAKAVLGDQEFNAIGFAQPDGMGHYLCTRSPKNLTQHARFL